MDKNTSILPFAEAVAAGHKTFLGTECKHGHKPPIRWICDRQCSECVREKLRKRYWSNPEKARQRWRGAYEKHRETILANAKAAYWADPVKQRERRKAFYRTWEANSESTRIANCKRANDWYYSHKEHASRTRSAWKAANKDRVISDVRARKARQRGAPGSFTSTSVREIMKLQKGRCAYFSFCRQRISLANCHRDHILPLTLGGTNYRKNIQLTCAACNLKKHARHPIEFANRLGMLL